MQCQKCRHNVNDDANFCDKCGSNVTKKKKLHWCATVSINIIVLLVIAGSIRLAAYYYDYNSPSEIELRALKTQMNLLQDYIALKNTFLSRGYLTLTEVRELRTIMEKAEKEKRKYPLGSEEYISYDDLTRDFTNPYSR